MADFATALRGRIVSALGHSRVYWTLVPQGTALSYVRMQTVSDPRPEHLQGYSASRQTRVQVDCFAATYAAARSMAETIIAAVALPATVGGVSFGRTKAEGPRDLGEDTSSGFVHRLSLDLLTEHSLA